MKKIEIRSFTHPRRSSDFCIHEEREQDGKTFAISGVIDTIGNPPRKLSSQAIKILNRAITDVIDDKSITDLESLDSRFCEELTKVNGLIRQIGASESIFGFCIVFLVRLDNHVRIHWMGDCRAYHFSWEIDEDSKKYGCRIKAVTLDNNSLTAKLLEVEEDEERDSFELMKNELLELSRQLKLYLGISSDENFAQEIARQTTALEMVENDALLLMTDGLYMPIVRNNVTNTNFRLTMDMHYLEDWIASYIDNGNYLIDYEGIERWYALTNDIKKSCIKYTKMKRRYRDDIAVIVTN